MFQYRANYIPPAHDLILRTSLLRSVFVLMLPYIDCISLRPISITQFAQL